MPYRIITNGGAPTFHHLRTAKAALEFVQKVRDEHPAISVVTDEGETLTVQQLEIRASAETKSNRQTTPTKD